MPQCHLEQTFMTGVFLWTGWRCAGRQIQILCLQLFGTGTMSMWHKPVHVTQTNPCAYFQVLLCSKVTYWEWSNLPRNLQDSGRYWSKPSDSAPGWTAFQSLGTLPGIFQFSSRDTASAITIVTCILISQMSVLKKLSESANLELCASYICCR